MYILISYTLFVTVVTCTVFSLVTYSYFACIHKVPFLYIMYTYCLTCTLSLSYLYTLHTLITYTSVCHDSYFYSDIVILEHCVYTLPSLYTMYTLYYLYNMYTIASMYTVHTLVTYTFACYSSHLYSGIVLLVHYVGQCCVC